MRDRVRLDSLLEFDPIDEGAFGGEDENMAILALTLLAIWGVFRHEFFNFSLLRSRLPVELADDLRLKISEFWNKEKNYCMIMLFFHDILMQMTA